MNEIKITSDKVTWLEIAYKLPKFKDEVFSIRLKKDGTKKYEESLRRIEEDLANKKARDIVYLITTGEYNEQNKD